MRFLAVVCIGLQMASVGWADRVTLIYGDVLEGTVLSEDESTVRFQNEYGERVFQKADIREIVRDGASAPVPAAPPASDAPIVQETGALPPEWSDAPAAPAAPAASTPSQVPSAPVDLPPGSWPSEPAAAPAAPQFGVAPSQPASSAQPLTPATSLGLPPRDPFGAAPTAPAASAPPPAFGAAPQSPAAPPAYAPPAFSPPPPAPPVAQVSTPYDILKMNIQIQSQWRDLEISYIQRAFVGSQAYETQYIGRILPPDYMRAKLITQVPPSQQAPRGGQVEYDMYRARGTLWQVAKVPGQPIQYLQMDASRVEGSAGGGPLDSFQKGFSGAGNDEQLLQIIARNSNILGSEVIEGVDCWVLETRYTPEVIDAQVVRAQPQAQASVRAQLSQMGVVRNWIGKQDMVQKKMESFTPAGAPLMGLTILSVKPNTGLDPEQLRMKVPKGTVWMDITDMMMRGGTPGTANAGMQQQAGPQQMYQQQAQQPQQPFQSFQSSAWQTPAQTQYQPQQQPMYQQPTQQQYSYTQPMPQQQQPQMWQQPQQQPAFQQNFVQPGYPGMPQQQQPQQQQGFLSRMFGF